jgi:hypothetical protein
MFQCFLVGGGEGRRLCGIGGQTPWLRMTLCCGWKAVTDAGKGLERCQDEQGLAE